MVHFSMNRLVRFSVENTLDQMRERESVCVCVCVCVLNRERKREIGRS